MLHEQTTDGGAKLGHEPTVTGALYPKERIDYLAAAVQTDQDETLALWTEEKTALQGVVEALRADKARALADVEFFRAQYSRASDFASSARSENEELLARATLAESQTTNGVAMVRATFENRVAKLEAEVQKYKALSEMLTERARRTDDDVRYRAAMTPELERQYQQLHRQFRETEAELEETQDDLRAERKANTSLRKLVTRLEAKEQANVVKSLDQEPLPWSDGKDDPDYIPGTTPPSCPSEEDSDGPSLQHQGSRDFPGEEDVVMPVGGKVEQSTPVEPGERTQTSNHDMVYLCRWRPGEPEGNCDVVVASKQVSPAHRLSKNCMLMLRRNYMSTCYLIIFPAIESPQLHLWGMLSLLTSHFHPCLVRVPFHSSRRVLRVTNGLHSSVRRHLATTSACPWCLAGLQRTLQLNTVNYCKSKRDVSSGEMQRHSTRSLQRVDLVDNCVLSRD